MEKRSLIAAILLASLFAPVPASADPRPPGGVMTAGGYLALDPGRRRAYVSGMADQITFLADAALERGFAWFPECLERLGLPVLEQAFTAYLNARPRALDEPAARSFVWSAAERCFAEGPS